MSLAFAAATICKSRWDGTRPQGGVMAEINPLRVLLEDELKDIYDAEKQLIRVQKKNKRR
jgi:hypothetical protein